MDLYALETYPKRSSTQLDRLFKGCCVAVGLIAIASVANYYLLLPHTGMHAFCGLNHKMTCAVYAFGSGGAATLLVGFVGIAILLGKEFADKRFCRELAHVMNGDHRKQIDDNEFDVQDAEICFERLQLGKNHPRLYIKLIRAIDRLENKDAALQSLFTDMASYVDYGFGLKKTEAFQEAAERVRTPQQTKQLKGTLAHWGI